MLASPNSSVSWKRRTSTSPRKITMRSFSGEDRQQVMAEPAKPIKVRKSQIRAQDPTAPVANQFAETVKRSASYLLKSIGMKRPELKGSLNRVYANFFTSFNSWMQTTGRTSQRKLNDPQPSLALLETRVSQCSEMIVPLMNELHAWSHVNPDIDFETAVEASDSEGTKEKLNASLQPIDEAVQLCDKISLAGQRKRGTLRELEARLHEIEIELRFRLQQDFAQQMNMSELLTPVET